MLRQPMGGVSRSEYLVGVLLRVKEMLSNLRNSPVASATGRRFPFKGTANGAANAAGSGSGQQSVQQPKAMGKKQ